MNNLEETEYSKDENSRRLIVKPEDSQQGCWAKTDKALISLSVMNFFLNAAVSIIIPFFPPLATNEHSISAGVVGLIMSCSSIGSFSSTFTAGKMMSVWGKKNMMVIGLIFQTLVVLMFGLIQYVDHNGWFITLAVISRLIQGISRSFYSVGSFAFVPQLWPNDVSQKIAILETVTGLGTMLGPAIGAGLYVVGYGCPFYVLAGIFGIFIFPTYFYLPVDKDQSKPKPAPLGKFFSQRFILVSFFLMTGLQVCQSFFYPTFTMHLEIYGKAPEIAALILTVQPVFYLSSLLSSRLWLRFFERKFLISLGILIAATSTQYLGPNMLIFGYNNSPLILNGVGLALLGISFACVALPFLPELIEYSVKNILPEAPQVCNNVCAAVFIGGYNLGTLLGSILGGQLFNAFQKSTSFDSQCPVIPVSQYANTTIYPNQTNGDPNVCVGKNLSFFCPNTYENPEVCYTEYQQSGISTFNYVALCISCISLLLWLTYMILGGGLKSWSVQLARCTGRYKKVEEVSVKVEYDDPMMDPENVGSMVRRESIVR